MRIIFFLSFCLACLQLFAQNKTLPSIEIKDLDGKTVLLSDLQADGKVRLYSFWATWCSPCKKELDAIDDYYADWQKKYDFELVAVSIDDARTLPKVKTTVAEKNWSYRILHDASQSLMKAAGINAVPYTILVDGKGNIVYEHNGYVPGDELELEEKIKELANK
jgi:cytochrome c biogenesis protein CcmG, thiol:disulfide interchange protein DsbE